MKKIKVLEKGTLSRRPSERKENPEKREVLGLRRSGFRVLRVIC